MINPKAARNFAKALSQRNKSDVIDARILSLAISIAKDKEIKVPIINGIADYMREMISFYKVKVKQRIMSSNHLESLTSKYEKDDDIKGNTKSSNKGNTKKKPKVNNNEISYKIKNTFLVDTINQEIIDYKNQEKDIIESIYAYSVSICLQYKKMIY